MSWQSLYDTAIGKLDDYSGRIRVECGRFAVLGDTHGYLSVSKWFIDSFLDDYECIFFLGDYVDRGPEGVENLDYILEMFVSSGKVFVLRGNHEDLRMNRYYGFLSQALSRGDNYFEELKILYSKLPLFAVVNNEFFLVHGGIPCRSCGNAPEPPFTVIELEERLRSMFSSGEDPLNDRILFQLLWNDPDLFLEWYAPNIRGEGTYLYGREAWKAFLLNSYLRMIIRAHERVNGVVIYTSSMRSIDHPANCIDKSELNMGVLTVFSSLYHGADAGAVLVGKDKICFKYYSPRPS